MGACADPVHGYFDDAAAIIDTMRAESLDATPRAGVITRPGVIEVNDARRAAVRALEALTPPQEVRPEHLALVTGLDDLVTAVDDFLVATADVENADFADAVVAATDLEGRTARVASACRTLGDRAVSLGVDIDIRC